MTLDCKLCGEWCYTSYICSKCNRIKDLTNLYGRDCVLAVLEKVLIRDEQQRINKMESNKKQQKKVSEIQEKVQTRSQTINKK